MRSRPRGLPASIRSPPNHTSPRVGRSPPPSMRSSEVLPAPFGPNTTRKPPEGRTTSMPSTAARLANSRTRPRASSRSGASASPGRLTRAPAPTASRAARDHWLQLQGEHRSMRRTYFPRRCRCHTRRTWCHSAVRSGPEQSRLRAREDAPPGPAAVSESTRSSAVSASAASSFRRAW